MVYVFLLAIAFITYFALKNPKAKPIHLDVSISTVAAMLIIFANEDSTGSFFRLSKWDFERNTNVDDFLIYSLTIFVLLLLLRKFVEQAKV